MRGAATPGGAGWGQYNLGRFHQNGRGGLTANDREAARLYKLAADQGNANARNNLGTFYRDGRGGLEKDDREAARLYKLAADQGNVFAEVGLGFFYETGRGGLPNKWSRARFATGFYNLELQLICSAVARGGRPGLI
jgi:TPR repeat protein